MHILIMYGIISQSMHAYSSLKRQRERERALIADQVKTMREHAAILPTPLPMGARRKMCLRVRSEPSEPHRLQRCTQLESQFLEPPLGRAVETDQVRERDKLYDKQQVPNATVGQLLCQLLARRGHLPRKCIEDTTQKSNIVNRKLLQPLNRVDAAYQTREDLYLNVKQARGGGPMNSMWKF